MISGFWHQNWPENGIFWRDIRVWNDVTLIINCEIRQMTQFLNQWNLWIPQRTFHTINSEILEACRQSKFLHFHAVLGKFWLTNRLTRVKVMFSEACVSHSVQRWRDGSLCRGTPPSRQRTNSGQRSLQTETPSRLRRAPDRDRPLNRDPTEQRTPSGQRHPLWTKTPLERDHPKTETPSNSHLI